MTSELKHRDIWEVANQLEGYVGPDTDERLANFLIREGKEAAKLAERIIELENIRAVPDVPELVAIDCGQTLAGLGVVISQLEYEGREGSLVYLREAVEILTQTIVLYDQAAEMIAAKDARIVAFVKNEQELEGKVELYKFKLETAEAELAQIKAQEPVGSLSDSNGVWWYSHGKTDGEIPLYSAPVDQTAEIERLREALKPFAEYMQDHGDKDNLGTPVPNEQGVGWIYLNHGHFRDARTALSGKESS